MTCAQTKQKSVYTYLASKTVRLANEMHVMIIRTNVIHTLNNKGTKFANTTIKL